MDHLPLPRNPEYEPIEIPCHSTENYDGDDFETYPGRGKWGLKPIREWKRIFKTPPREFSGFLQTWLFFGLLESVLRFQFRLSDFTFTSKTGHLVVKTTKMLPALDKWVKTLPTMNESQKGDLWKTVLLAKRVDLRLASGFGVSVYGSQLPPEREIGLLAFMEMSLYYADPRDKAIAASIGLLIEVLLACLSLDSLSDTGPTRHLTMMTGQNFTFRQWNSLIYQRMRSNGWCPSALSMLFSRINTSALLFMSHVGRPSPNKEHHMIRIRSISSSESLPTGELCTKDRCPVYQLDDKTYETAHTKDCTRERCYDIVADKEKILSILKSGRIPLIRSIDKRNKNCKVDLVASDRDSKYVAISHVWSDGLGNMDRSALPRCQMLRLSNLIRSLPGEASGLVYFWIDTIGCPPDKANQSEAQDLAISKMRQTYEQAHAVLVLDSYLLPQRVNDMEDEEILLKIVCSAWNSRLWTLQEGALAQMLFFQFDGEAYNIDDGISRLNRKRDLALDVTLKPTINQRVYEFRGSFRRGQDGADRKLAALKHALTYRTTSVSTDEAICLAALLDLNVDNILNTPKEPEERRMETFWRMVKRVPVTLAFHFRPRLEIPGYRWAPRTLLRVKSESEMFIYSDGALKPAEVTKNGLSFERAGFIFRTERKGFGAGFHARDENLTWYRFICKMYDDQEDYHPDDDAENRSFNPWSLHGAEHVAYIPMSLKNTEDSFYQGISTKEMGILASIVLREQGVLYVRYICHTWRITLSQLDDSHILEQCNSVLPPNMPYEKAVGLGLRSSDQLIFCTLGLRMGREQRWCID